MNLAKQGFEAYTESQCKIAHIVCQGLACQSHRTIANVRKTGGQEYNSPHHSGQSGQPQQQQQQWNYGGDSKINR